MMTLQELLRILTGAKFGYGQLWTAVAMLPLKKLNFEITGFIVKGNNMIATGNMGQLFNASEIYHKGIE